MKTCKWWVLAAVVLSMAMISACGAKPTANGTQSEQAVEKPTTDLPETTSKSDSKEQTLDVYVADDDLIALKSYKKAILYTNDDEKYRAVLEALQLSDNDKDIPLWKNIEFKSVKMDKGTLVIDIHISDKGHLGAGGEQLALDALAKTLFQFQEMDAIDILVDGKAATSMMGHVTLDHPIKRP